MAKFIRYALATFCFAASVGCLAMWGWSTLRSLELNVPIPTSAQMLSLTAKQGMCYFMPISIDPNSPLPADVQLSNARVQVAVIDILVRQKKIHKISVDYEIVHFPLWYPALVFALACVASLRFRRQFTIRSALIAVSVVAALLGMVAAL